MAASGGELSIRSKANWIFGFAGGAVLVVGCGSGRGDSLDLAFKAGVDVSTGAVATLASSETCLTISEGGSDMREGCFGDSVDCEAPDGGFAGSVDCCAGSEAGFGDSAKALATSDGCF